MSEASGKSVSWQERRLTQSQELLYHLWSNFTRACHTLDFMFILLRKESKKLFLWNHTIGYKMQNERICIKKSFFSSSTSKGTKFCIILYIPLYCLWNWLILFSTHEEISVFWRSAHDTRLNWNWTKKRKNDFLYIFVFAQYFSNALFWVPHIAEIKKSIFYEFDFICMKNSISHIFFSNSSMKKWVTFRKKYYDLYSCGNLKCVVLRNRMRNEKNDKNSCFHLYNTGRNIFWYFHLPLRKRWKKWFPTFKKSVYTLVIIIYEIYFNLVFKDFPGRRRAKCTKLSRCCFWQCFCKLKFTIFSQHFCPRNKLFWNSFPQRYLW